VAAPGSATKGDLPAAGSAVTSRAVCCRSAVSAGNLEDFPFYRRALAGRFSGEQLAGNAQVVGGVPCDAGAVQGDKPGHHPEHGLVLIMQQRLDFRGVR